MTARDRSYYVYVITNCSGTLYVGITSDLIRRIHEHKSRTHDGFSSKYKIDRFVFYEVFKNTHDALRTEKQIKGWRREKKIAMIEKMNPEWKDLSKEWM